MHEGIPRDNVTVEYLGVEPGELPARNPRREPRLIFVGRLKAYKRVELLLDVLEAIPEAVLDVVGEGDHRPDIEAEVERRGLGSRVVMHGYVDDERKAELYGRAWVDVTASGSEGWSLTVMESALCGTPSAALAVGGLTESIVDDETGLLADSPREFRCACASWCAQPELRSRLGDAAERRARSLRGIAQRWRTSRCCAERPPAKPGTGPCAARLRPRSGDGQGAVSVELGERDFDAALAAVTGVDGWLSDDQARRLWEAAVLVRSPGRIVEIGSFRGRSTIVLRLAARPGVEVVAIDPHGGADRGPQEIPPDALRGEEDNRPFRANLAAAGVIDGVAHVRRMSHDAHPEVEDPIDVLYVDGAHRYGPARADIEHWGERVRPGGTMLVHDSYNAVGVMLAQTSRPVPLGRVAVPWTKPLAGPVQPGEPVASGADPKSAAPGRRHGYFVRNCSHQGGPPAQAAPCSSTPGQPDEDAWPY